MYNVNTKHFKQKKKYIKFEKKVNAEKFVERTNRELGGRWKLLNNKSAKMYLNEIKETENLIKIAKKVQYLIDELKQERERITEKYLNKKSYKTMF